MVEAVLAAGRVLVAQESCALRLTHASFRAREALRLHSHTRGDGGVSFRVVLREGVVAPASGLVAPVTVADSLGRFAPAVFLVRVPHETDQLLAAVAAGLAPLHELGPDEELVALPSLARRPSDALADALHVRAASGLVYVGADALRHALAGNLIGDALYTMADPGSAYVRYNRPVVSGLVFTVLPRERPESRLYVHCVDGEPLSCAVPAHVVGGAAGLAMALAPFGLEPPADHEHEGSFMDWTPETTTDTSTVASRLARRQAVPVDPELDAAFVAQARFLEVLNAALLINAGGGADAAWVDVSVASDGAALLVGVVVRLYGPLDARAPLGRHALNALTCASPLRQDVGDAYLANVVVRPSGGWVASSEDLVLRWSEAVSARRGLPEPPPLLRLPLRPHQLRTLAFMQDAEDAPPLLHRLCDSNVRGLTGGWLPHVRMEGGMYGVHLPVPLDARCRGGIVANRAGTGKTLVALSLVLSRPALALDPGRAQAVGPAPATGRATLVLCPTSIVTQWAAEAARACPTLAVHALRPGQAASMAHLSATCDVVVCGFPMMFNKRLDLIRAVPWHRVVVDEAHLARNHVAPLAGLRTQRVWCLTGTPMGAGATPRELDALLRMVTGVAGMTFAPPPTMRSYRVMNLLNQPCVAPLFDVVARTMVRLGPPTRETDTIDSDRIVWLPLPASARPAYDRLEAESQADVVNLVRRTQFALLRPLQRLRDWCSGAPTLHVRYVHRDPDDRVDGDADPLARGVPYDAAVHGVGFNDPDADVCTVCLEPLMYARLAMPPCRHWFCLPCISVAMARAPRCPTCRKPATPATLRVQPEALPEPIDVADVDAAAAAAAAVDEAEADHPPPPDAVFDAKVAGLVGLAAEAGADEKLIVFTRHTVLARRYAEALSAWGVPSVHYTRSLSERERNANKARFMAEPELRVIVLDLDNAEGIDGLQVARHVVFCEPFPATEGNQRTQAVSRCDRLGQARPVVVRTLAFQDTAEARLATYAPDRATPPIRRVRHYVGLD